MILDLTGKYCPEPANEIQRILMQDHPSNLQVLVEDEFEYLNIKQVVDKLSYTTTCIDEGEHKLVDIRKEEKTMILTNKTLVVQDEFLGKGNDELGAILIKSFFTTLAKSTRYPMRILFYNSGVKLTHTQSAVLEELKQLENNGVELISCRTCLSFYEMLDDCAVGSIGSMDMIVDAMMSSDPFITI